MATRGFENVTESDIARQGNIVRAKPSKYRNQKTVVDNITFDSKKEARRYQELKALEKAGRIRGLVIQPSYPLDAFGVESRPIGVYRADFAYWALPDLSPLHPPWDEPPTIQQFVEDVKGFKTALYKWKKRHVEAQYGIQIREI